MIRLCLSLIMIKRSTPDWTFTAALGAVNRQGAIWVRIIQSAGESVQMSKKHVLQQLQHCLAKLCVVDMHARSYAIACSPILFE